MDANMMVLMESNYTVPEASANETKAYELAAVLRRELNGSQQVTLNALMEACVDWVGDAAEDAFEQGVLTGTIETTDTKDS